MRYVQVARNGHSQADGYTVLSDAAGGDRVYAEGVWKLSDEMAIGGLVPQTAGARRCSMHFKGFALDRWIADNVEGSFRHAIGFARGEERRVAKDQGFGAGIGRLPEYPLITWGWDRATAEAFITSVTGVAWPKSCCTFCPFATDLHLDRYMASPAEAIKGMRLEHTAVALNPTQLLFKDRSVVDAVTAAGITAAVEAHAEYLARTTYALYEVRRAIPATKADPTKAAPAVRSVVTHDTGSRPAMLEALAAAGRARGAEVTVDDRGHARVVLIDRTELPVIRHEFVVAPAGVADKERASFATVYGRALVDAGLAEAPQGSLFAA